MVKGYFSFLLRLWQASTAEGTIWRASLENVPTGERRVFGGVDDLVTYLRERTGTRSPGESAPEEESPPGAEDAPPLDVERD